MPGRGSAAAPAAPRQARRGWPGRDDPPLPRAGGRLPDRGLPPLRDPFAEGLSGLNPLGLDARAATSARGPRRRPRLHDPRPACSSRTASASAPSRSAQEWLHHLPFLRRLHSRARRYREPRRGVRPPETATLATPTASGSGADPRRHVGLRVAGRPGRAVGWPSATPRSRTPQNGIYGEMWAAALVAAAFAAGDMRAALEAPSGHVPPRSRLGRGAARRGGCTPQGATWDRPATGSRSATAR